MYGADERGSLDPRARPPAGAVGAIAMMVFAGGAAPWGMLHPVSRQPGELYEIRLWTPAIPDALIVLAGPAAPGLLLAWNLRYAHPAIARPAQPGRAAPAPHVAITVGNC